MGGTNNAGRLLRKTFPPPRSQSRFLPEVLLGLGGKWDHGGVQGEKKAMNRLAAMKGRGRKGRKNTGGGGSTHVEANRNAASTHCACFLLEFITTQLKVSKKIPVHQRLFFYFFYILFFEHRELWLGTSSCLKKAFKYFCGSQENNGPLFSSEFLSFTPFCGKEAAIERPLCFYEALLG